METTHAFDNFLSQLQLRLEQHPTEQRHILEQALLETACPYLRKILDEIPKKNSKQST
ncbi:MAG: hypothetical protein ACFB15_23080 [Cyclobacteriaceae bacterium]